MDQTEAALGAEMRVAADKGTGRAKARAGAEKEKVVRQALSKVYTNGTLVDAALLTDEHASHCVAVREEGEEHPKTGAQRVALCVLDSATRAFSLCAFEDDVCLTTLEMALRQLRQKEVMFTEVGFACFAVRCVC